MKASDFDSSKTDEFVYLLYLLFETEYDKILIKYAVILFRFESIEKKKKKTFITFTHKYINNEQRSINTVQHKIQI